MQVHKNDKYNQFISHLSRVYFPHLKKPSNNLQKKETKVKLGEHLLKLLWSQQEFKQYFEKNEQHSTNKTKIISPQVELLKNGLNK